MDDTNEFNSTYIGEFEEMEDIYLNFTNGTPSTDMATMAPYSQRPETYVVPVVFVIMFVIGVVGNSVIVYIYARYRKMRSSPNTLITSLAVGDLILFLGTVPFIFTIYTFEGWPYGEFVCKMSEFMRDLSVGVTVFTLTVLSFDRYLAIAWPLHRHKSKYSKRFTVIIIVVIWTLSICVATPGACFARVLRAHSRGGEIEVCYPFKVEDYPYYPRLMVMTKFVILYAIPLTIATLFYILMALNLLTSRSPISLGVNDSQAHLVKVRAKVAKIVLALVLLFAVCLLPNHLFLLWFYFSGDGARQYNQFWHVLKIMGYVMAFANSCLNPVVLYFISGVYRDHFRQCLFYCCCPPKPKGFKGIQTGYSSRTFSKVTAISRV